MTLKKRIVLSGFVLSLAVLAFFAFRYLKKAWEPIPDKGSRPYELEAARYPGDFLTPDSFDVIAEYLAEKHRRWAVRDPWYEELVQACRAAWPGPWMADSDRRDLLQELLERPQTAIDGSKYSLGQGVALSQLVQGGLPQKYADALALEYCKLKRNAYVAVLLPRGYDQREPLLNSVEKVGTLIYQRSVDISGPGQRNYVRWAYDLLCDGPHKWVHEEPRATQQIQKRFCRQAPTTFLVFESPAWKIVRRWKLAARKLGRMGTSALHAPDTHRETVALAQLFLNENSRHLLNHATGVDSGQLETLLRHLKETACSPPYPQEQACFDGPAALCLYGLNSSNQEFPVLSHSADGSWDSLIFNPDHHFIFAGMKFAALHTLKCHISYSLREF